MSKFKSQYEFAGKYNMKTTHEITEQEDRRDLAQSELNLKIRVQGCCKLPTYDDVNDKLVPTSVFEGEVFVTDSDRDCLYKAVIVFEESWRVIGRGPDIVTAAYNAYIDYQMGFYTAVK